MENNFDITKMYIDNKKKIGISNIFSIFINREKNKENIAKIKTLELLFLEFGLELKVFWKNHFGVVSVGETVKIDEIAVF